MYVSRIRIDQHRYFHGGRAVDLELTRPDGSHSGWTVLAGPNGSGKTSLLQALGGLGAARLDDEHGRPLRPGDHFCAVLPAAPAAPARLPEGALALLDDGLLPEGYRIAGHGPDGLRVELGGAVLPLEALGGGARALVALVAELLRQAHCWEPEEELVVPGGPPTAPIAGLALIDDAEAHLHPAWQQRLGEWLVGHFPNLQFVVATHSPYVCQAADPGGLIHLPGPGEPPSPPRVLDEDEQQRVVYGSGDDAAVSALFGLPSAYSPQAEAERELLVALERKLYAGQATAAEIAEYQELGAKLNSSLAARAQELRGRIGGGS
ncbi:AAA family ATPase [Kitasatospora sp. NPDC002227]|uniref:AAA family ATPase n=1 Tax=Kitasatospora sp. NPDC002227 TaxID=3154773 RepID=UPI00332E1069